jgi:mRNA interferase RelE/StbE
MALEFELLPHAEKQLRALDVPTIKRILKKLSWIADQHDPLRHAVILHNAKIGDLRFRIGDYRVVCILDRPRKKVTIVAIGHRRDIYRQ